VRRFAQGTKAGFALSLINNKLEAGAPLGLYIEAVKDGEDPITFGPSSVLVSYGNGWKLQTVVDYQGKLDLGSMLILFWKINSNIIGKFSSFCKI